MNYSRKNGRTKTSHSFRRLWDSTLVPVNIGVFEADRRFSFQ